MTKMSVEIEGSVAEVTGSFSSLGARSNGRPQTMLADPWRRQPAGGRRPLPGRGCRGQRTKRLPVNGRRRWPANSWLGWLVMRMGRALRGFQRERGLALSRPVAANNLLQSYFVDPDFAAVANSRMFDERMRQPPADGAGRP